MFAQFDLPDHPDRDGSFLWVFAETEGGMFLLNEGFDGSSANLMSVTEKNEKYDFTPAGQISCTADGCVLTMEIPKSTLSLVPGGILKLRVVDSRDPVESTLDFYDHGDCLPLGRVWYGCTVQ